MVSFVFTALQNVELMACYLTKDTNVCVTLLIYNIIYIVYLIYILFITFCRIDKSKPYKA